MQFNAAYLLMLTALVGTTIAPWQFFYLQAGFVEKRIGPAPVCAGARGRIAGSVTCMVIVFFIIVSTAATLYASGHRTIDGRGGRGRALVPLAGKWAANAVRLWPAECVAICRVHSAALHRPRDLRRAGLRGGIDHKFSEAPIFYWLYTILIVVGGGLILIPKAPLWRILVLSQVANGIWLPIVLIFMILLINRKDLMGDQVNRRTFNAVAWVTSIAMIALTLVLIYFGIFHPSAAPGVACSARRCAVTRRGTKTGPRRS